MGTEAGFQTEPRSGCLDTEPVRLAPVLPPLPPPPTRCWKSAALALSCVHNAEPRLLFLTSSVGAPEVCRNWGLPHLLEYQSHQVWTETAAQNRRGWVARPPLRLLEVSAYRSCVIFAS